MTISWTSQQAIVGDDRLERVFTSAEEFQSWWHGASGRTEGAPVIDFTSHVVVAVSSGRQPNACHAIDLLGARREADTIVVEVLRRTPAEGAICATMMVHPTAVAALTRPAASIRFDWRDSAEASP